MKTRGRMSTVPEPTPTSGPDSVSALGGLIAAQVNDAIATRDQTRSAAARLSELVSSDAGTFLGAQAFTPQLLRTLGKCACPAHDAVSGSATSAYYRPSNFDGS